MENMNQIQMFTNEIFGNVRAIDIDDKVWFFGEDIVTDLQYNLEANSYTKYIKRFVKDKYAMKVDSKSQVKNVGFNYKELGQRGGYLINQYGVIQLVANSEVINESKKQEFLKWLGIESEAIVLTSRKEIEFLDVLKEQLSVFGITQFERQYSNLNCGNYKIDLFIPELNVAIEYDENRHQGYSYEAHELRQQLIEKELGCHFIRVSDNKSHVENSAIVLCELMKLNLLK